jgi:hypothetical protein
MSYYRIQIDELAGVTLQTSDDFQGTMTLN